jgi:hypothetical protein
MGTKERIFTPREKRRAQSNSNSSCRNCGYHSLEWRERSPDDIHRYEVVCPRCEQHYKWGSVGELESLKESDNAPVVIAYQPPRTVDEFFE